MEIKPTIDSLEHRIKELEAKLDTAESYHLQVGYYQHMLNHTQQLSNIGSWNWDLVTNTIEWSDMMFKLLGLEPNEAVPSYDLALHHVHEKDKKFYVKALEEAVNNKTSFYLENRIVKKDNSVISVISRGRCFKDSEGNLVRMIGTVQDITEQQKAFDKLLEVNVKSKEIEKKLHEAQRLSMIGSWEYEPKTKRFHWSKEMYRIFGLDSDIKDPTFKDLKKLIPPHEWKELDKALSKATQEGIPFQLNVKLHLQNGANKTVIIICQPDLKKTGKMYSLKGTIQDISTLKIAENKLQALNLSLEEKVKERTAELINSLEREKKISELKSNFVSITSHEFRTPLTIIGLSTTLIEKYIQKGKLEHIQLQLDKIRSAVINLVQILDDLLTIGKIEGGKVNTQKIATDIKKLTNALMTEISALTKKGQNLNYTHQGSTEIDIDVNLYGGIFINLLSNAIKYSEGEIQIKTQLQGHNLVMSIEDSGIGIPFVDQKKIFSKYFRGSNSTRIAGTGLGLNIVFQYVELLKGSIEFTSIPGKGTTFIVVLPS